jgi:hypothetical protein
MRYCRSLRSPRAKEALQGHIEIQGEADSRHRMDRPDALICQAVRRPKHAPEDRREGNRPRREVRGGEERLLVEPAAIAVVAAEGADLLGKPGEEGGIRDRRVPVVFDQVDRTHPGGRVQFRPGGQAALGEAVGGDPEADDDLVPPLPGVGSDQGLQFRNVPGTPNIQPRGEQGRGT